MGGIFVITGKTGAGKSTLCQRIAKVINCKQLSFASAGKEFAKTKGYSHIRKCYYELGEETFKKEFTDFFSNIIKKQVDESAVILIDGLYVKSIAERLKSIYNAKFVYIDVSEKVCFQRISIRDEVGETEVGKEYFSKEQLKKYLGSDALLNLSDIIIDGTREPNLVYNEVYRFIKQYL